MDISKSDITVTNTLNDKMLEKSSCYITLAKEESPARIEESDDATYGSYHERETEDCKDSSDTDSDTDSYTTMEVLEYEVATASESEDLYSNDSSSGIDEILFAALAQRLCEDSMSSDISDFAIYADTEESDGVTDPELRLADYWECVKCKNKQNNPMYRYCEKCYQIRKNHFPPRPKKRRKSRKDITKRRPTSRGLYSDDSLTSNSAHGKSEPSTSPKSAPIRRIGNSIKLIGKENSVREKNKLTRQNRISCSSQGQPSVNSAGESSYTEDENMEQLGNGLMSVQKFLENGNVSLNEDEKRLIKSTGSQREQLQLKRQQERNQNMNTNRLLTNDRWLPDFKIECPDVNNFFIEVKDRKINDGSSIVAAMPPSCSSTNVDSAGNASSEFFAVSSKVNDDAHIANGDSGSSVEGNNSSLNRKRKFENNEPEADFVVSSRKKSKIGQSSSSHYKVNENKQTLSLDFLKYFRDMDHADDTDSSDSCNKLKRPTNLSCKDSGISSCSSQELSSPTDFLTLPTIPKSPSPQPPRTNCQKLQSSQEDVDEIKSMVNFPKLSKISSIDSGIHFSQEIITEMSSNPPDSEGYNCNKKPKNEIKSLEFQQKFDKNSNVDDSSSCMMCLSQPKNGVFVHSRFVHLCCCYKCAVKVWNKSKRCPICNGKVKNVLKLFVQ